MGGVVMKLLAVHGVDIDPPLYVEAFDPDAGPPDVSYPTGSLVSTPDVSHAKVYADMGAAIAEWQSRSSRTPVRPDGEPNRPLTAYTVTFDPAPAP